MQCLRSILVQTLPVLAIVACGKGDERTSTGDRATAPAAPVQLDSAGAAADAKPAIDLTKTRAELKARADKICACKDVRCADPVTKEQLIWSKELDLQRDHVEHRAYVDAVDADAQIIELRRRITECSRALR